MPGPFNEPASQLSGGCQLPPGKHRDGTTFTKEKGRNLPFIHHLAVILNQSLLLLQACVPNYKANPLTSSSQSSAVRGRTGLGLRAHVRQVGGLSLEVDFQLSHFSFEIFVLGGGVTSLCLQCHNCTISTLFPFSYSSVHGIVFRPLSVCMMTFNCHLPVFLCLRTLFSWNEG